MAPSRAASAASVRSQPMRRPPHTALLDDGDDTLLPERRRQPPPAGRGEPGGVDGHRDEPSAGALDHAERTRVRRVLHQHAVAGLQQRLDHQRTRVPDAGGHHDLVGVGRQSPGGEPLRHGGAQLGQPRVEVAVAPVIAGNCSSAAR